MEKEYGALSSSLQNLRIIASSRAPEKENMAGNNSDDRRRKRRVADEGCSTLMAMQNLEKERASLKISQSLAEARSVGSYVSWTGCTCGLGIIYDI